MPADPLVGAVPMRQGQGCPICEHSPSLFRTRTGTRDEETDAINPIRLDYARFHRPMIQERLIPHIGMRGHVRWGGLAHSHLRQNKEPAHQQDAPYRADFPPAQAQACSVRIHSNMG